MKKLHVFLTFLFFNVYGFTDAQGIMNFAEETHDFGTVDEGTLASYEFEFTNTGNQPIEIKEVKASCGCTAPSWTKGSVFPGKKGIIKASYDSQGRPGPFNKSLTVTSNAKKSTLILYIKGFVKAKTSSVKESDKYKMAQEAANSDVKLYPTVQLDKYNHDFGRVELGQKVKYRFNIFNSGRANLLITSLESQCKCVSFGLSTGAIRPSETAILELTLDANKIQKLDETFTLHTNDPNNPTKTIKLTAEIFENFEKHLFKAKKTGNPFE